MDPPGACVPNVGARRDNAFLTDSIPLTESSTPGTFEPFPVPSLFEPGARAPQDDTGYALSCVGPDGEQTLHLLNGRAVFFEAFRVFTSRATPCHRDCLQLVDQS